ncbi:TetR/AcrR family transcriptional regulator [Paraburkholderia sp.]|uniref:TetR/AcrR family transcriptional regulator n=1 Tax=Paraburkholderia sp. TaxID=1926495 RepID=UPI0023827EFD|nr:TetR/AcrR family transcriptional regulator [Paraburkholderia sp.]MDE1182206.1 helix-turn-helix domain containing protein [Paraburkholderia sp.]
MNAVTSGSHKPVEKKRTRGRPACSAAVGADVLLRCARRIFAKRGFDASSVREIARDSGVDPALIAHHFGSKEALWLAVVDQIGEQIAPLIDATAQLRSAELSHRERVERAIVLFIDQVFNEPDTGMFFSTAATEQGARLDALINRLVRPYHDVFVPLLADASKAKELKSHDPEVLFSMLTHAISKTVAYSHVLQAFSSLPDDEKRFKRTVIKTALGMLGD